jgi:hypothetical protein
MNYYDMLRRLVECSTMYPQEKHTAVELIDELEQTTAMGTVTSIKTVEEQCEHPGYAYAYFNPLDPRRGPRGPLICIRCGKEKGA